MLKLRLKKTGKKNQPSYRLVVMENRTKRDGRAIDQVGYYNPISKQFSFKTDKIIKWLKVGVKPTDTVSSLLKKANIINN